jgi:hypothetical protein
MDFYWTLDFRKTFCFHQLMVCKDASLGVVNLILDVMCINPKKQETILNILGVKSTGDVHEGLKKLIDSNPEALRQLTVHLM